MKNLVICLFISVFFTTTIFANDLTEVYPPISSENLASDTTNENKNFPLLEELELLINEDKAEVKKIFENYEDIDLSNAVFEDFEQDNFKYVKSDVQVERVTKEDVKEEQEILEIILSANDKATLSNEQILDLFQNELPYEQDGYTGILEKDLSSLKIEVNQTESNTTYTSQTITLTETKTYYGLESNDYSLIPKTITKDGVTLNLIDANFVSTNNEAISTVANTGVSTLYNCNTIYKGSYVKKIPNTKTNILDYKVTVNYKGNISKEIFEKNIITVMYAGEKITDLIVPIAVATTTGTTGIFGFVIFLFIKKNVKIYNVINGSYQLIGKCKITEKNKNINLTTVSMKADSNAYKIIFDNSIGKKLDNQEINITLNNVTKLKKLQYNENITFIDVTF